MWRTGSRFSYPSAFAAKVWLTSLRGIALEADPLAAGFAVLGQEFLLFLVVDADQIGSSGYAVLMSCSPALLLGPVHVVEELKINQHNNSALESSLTYAPFVGWLLCSSF